MKLSDITLRRLSLPLHKPYQRSYRVDHAFDPILVEVRDADGRVGWGDAVIVPGYTKETPERGWTFLRGLGELLAGRDTEAAKAEVAKHLEEHPCAVTAMTAAIEMLEGNGLLEAKPATVPILQGLSTRKLDEVQDEVARILASGFRTIKVKVGWDVEADLDYVSAVQAAVAGQAAIRIDANRGFSRADGCRFASSLDPQDIMLFEQPCDADDWDANRAVAEVSKVPIMLDESIYALADIERAAKVPGVAFVKLKLKKTGGLERLNAGLNRIRELGMTPVLGDGVASDLSCWMEACVARTAIDNAGEMNGFLRLKSGLFAQPVEFSSGAIVLAEGFRPKIDDNTLNTVTVAIERYATRTVTS